MVGNMDTVWYENGKLRIIDQTLLPEKLCAIQLDSIESVYEAIKRLQVRGAPAIGVTAALALAMLAERGADKSELCKAGKYLISARPTAVNLEWAVMRVINSENPIGEALKIRDNDIAVCRMLGENGLSLIKPKSGILTHCNAGALATVRYGTATSPLYLAHERGYELRIYCDETRPLLQGTRLTAYELMNAGMNVTLQCDSMAASLMERGLINAVFVGCDRMAANGDGANKIGTLSIAIIAKHFKIPFYMFVPMSTFDLNAKMGKDIVIEHRSEDEITDLWFKKRMAPENVKVYNPAFDITPAELITAVVTEKGILRAPFEDSIKNIFTV